VLQSGNLIPFLTAGENVELAITLAGGGRPSARARELLSEVGIAHRVDHLPRRLSGGETQRVAVAMALANEPELLLADEVTGELDSASAEAVMATIFGAWRDLDDFLAATAAFDEEAHGVACSCTRSTSMRRCR
jgi:putative ABC transport system ATP-binding protein